MFVTGTDVAQVRRYFERQPTAILRALEANLRHEILDRQAEASYAVLLDVLASR